MKGLLKYLSPFAPDQSGATSVLYDMGGITVICDAGGCTGNICGFDEPRWFMRKSAIFSAGLRDMDAILGRDDRLVDKLKDTAQKVDASFAAIIGTPVPAVIATDYQALKRMAEKRCGLPVITVDCTGTRLYDEGAEETYLQLLKRFVQTVDCQVDDNQVDESKSWRDGGKRIGVFGVSPLDTSELQADVKLKKLLSDFGWEEIYTYGMGSGIDEVAKAATVDMNLVISPSGLAPARYMKKEYGIPYEAAYPLLDEELTAQFNELEGKRILIVHQQVVANEIRQKIQENSNADVTVASWFMLKPELSCEKDFHISSEHHFTRIADSSDYDVIIGDALLHRAAKNFDGRWIHAPHFAVSGTCKE